MYWRSALAEGDAYSKKEVHSSKEFLEDEFCMGSFRWFQSLVNLFISVQTRCIVTGSPVL